MAGRIVVLEFDDANMAEAFLHNPKALEHDGAKAVGVFFRPNAYCSCQVSGSRSIDSWFKGRKTGLYMCRKCRKPSLHHKQGVMARLQYVFGYNQLEGGE